MAGLNPETVTNRVLKLAADPAPIGNTPSLNRAATAPAVVNARSCVTVAPSAGTTPLAIGVRAPLNGSVACTAYGPTASVPARYRPPASVWTTIDGLKIGATLPVIVTFAPVTGD